MKMKIIREDRLLDNVIGIIEEIVPKLSQDKQISFMKSLILNLMDLNEQTDRELLYISLYKALEDYIRENDNSKEK